MPSRQNVAKYGIEHSAWIGSTEIQWTTKVQQRANPWLLEAPADLNQNFFPCICSILCHHFTFDT